MKKIKLITASFGNWKKQLNVRVPLVYKDYVIDQVFYDDHNTSSRLLSLHPRTKCKIPKMMEWLTHPDYDYYIWIDSRFTIMEGFMENMMEEANDDTIELFLFNHPERSSIRSEMDFMRNNMDKGDTYLLDRYEGELMEEQVDLYLGDKSFVDDKLFYGGLFMYSKRMFENKNYNMMIDWLLNCVLYSVQDQLSLPYLVHKHKVNYKLYHHHLDHTSFIR